ncbi:hypothetical protein [Rhodopirellula sp. P2]|uniref:hypothetical protein n=1 Tax=Rhodopirellula sp. P2 TaxID=2127060 RepID=UPI0023674A22|nr:hypothetical protein [Rhodopirellula sp. P2]WDQ15653.1 hypothetical protein PSR62_18665 [Rhodopirellula sp. P2]
MSNSQVPSDRETRQFISGKRTILVVSPQRWDHLKLSKHHYAEELARLGNQVYFLNPFTRLGCPGRIRIRKSGIKNLHIIDQQFLLPLRLFDIQGSFAQLLLKRRLVDLAKVVGGKFDISWNFDNSSGAFMDQTILPAKYRIFQPVDRIDRTAAALSEPDLLISVAENILDDYDTPKEKKLLVPHAIGIEFLNFARNCLGSDAAKRDGKGRIQVGYVGNLEIPALDRTTLQRLVRNFPEIQFHFIGPFDENPTLDKSSWLNFCRTAPNALLHGLRTPIEILEYAKQIDVWLVCYDRQRDRNSASNCHKITEYLATGSVVVSSRIDAFAGRGDLLTMAKDGTSDSFLEAFADAVQDLSYLNSQTLQDARLRFAISRSCREVLQQIQRKIESITAIE